MTPEKARQILNNIRASVDAGLASNRDITAYIARLEVVWGYVVTETNGRYEVFEGNLE